MQGGLFDMVLKVCFISPLPVQQIREEQSPPTIQMTINSDAFNLATKKPPVKHQFPILEI
jgi:hypothetical protein